MFLHLSTIFITALNFSFGVSAMRVCVIGAGPSGLVAGRHLSQAGLDYDILEMTDAIGGTWVYSQTTTDKFGHETNRNLYQNLRTNLPKDVMEFQGLKYELKESFLPAPNILEYLVEYSKLFNVTENVKLNHYVKNISLTNDDKWLVQYKNMDTNELKSTIYDAVIICNGHHNVPRYPTIEGQDTFNGMAIHSKSYRVPSSFKNMNVLVIGFGPSGQDIAIDVSSCAKKVFLSHHSTEFKPDVYPSNVISKSDVKRISNNTIHFIDNTTEEVDAIIYCTGYLFSYPFLHESCGISCEDNYVSPLYKQFININHPTMCFICLTFRTYLMPLMEMQATVFVKYLQDKSTLPNKDIMMKDLEGFEKSVADRPKTKYHLLSNNAEYLESLSEIGKVKPVSPVIEKIYQHNKLHRHLNVSDYRNYCYEQIDENEYKVTYSKKKP